MVFELVYIPRFELGMSSSSTSRRHTCIAMVLAKNSSSRVRCTRKALGESDYCRTHQPEPEWKSTISDEKIAELYETLPDDMRELSTDGFLAKLDDEIWMRQGVEEALLTLSGASPYEDRLLTPSQLDTHRKVDRMVAEVHLAGFCRNGSGITITNKGVVTKYSSPHPPSYYV